MFVYGFDEMLGDRQQTVKFAKKSKLNSTQFLILTPLPFGIFYKVSRKSDSVP